VSGRAQTVTIVYSRPLRRQLLKTSFHAAEMYAAGKANAALNILGIYLFIYAFQSRPAASYSVSFGTQA